MIQRNFLTTAIISSLYCCENVFILMKYMDDWEKVNEASLLGKKDFYSLLDMEEITDALCACKKSL